ncbi:unknown protein [Microcystis aeruginosa NIES-843]|uniref:Uncharacterized protein n=1 Tax=Microcystis aeruginosa (strain NIES-843 / IAM M-2473) TaxID=449447 RepID=B0JFZ5_MICAN|nr:unknown protein [Microcystis aeruginosa NIES-843]
MSLFSIVVPDFHRANKIRCWPAIPNSECSKIDRGRVSLAPVNAPLMEAAGIFIPRNRFSGT